MPQMPMMQMQAAMQEQYQMAELRLKMKEKELILKEKELRLIMKEQQLKQAGGVASKPLATATKTQVRGAIPPAAAFLMDEDMMDEPEEDEMCECEMDRSGNVVVTLQDTPIVTITPTGEVTISTGGWWTQETLDAMNRVLKYISVSIKVASGSVEEGNWAVIYRGQMKRFEDDHKIFPVGPQSDKRGALVLASFQNFQQAEVQEELPSFAANRRLHKQGRM